MLVVRALCGSWSSGAAFRAFLAETLHKLGVAPSKANPDVWMQPAIKANGFECHECVLCHVDDVLCVSDNPMQLMGHIQKNFKLKNDAIIEPDCYLGAAMTQMTNDENKNVWAMSLDECCCTAVDNVESVLAGKGLQLPSKCYKPLMANHRPELDDTAELKADGVQWHQELIGMLRWAVEIGRVDVNLEVSMMSSHLALPRQGHLEAVSHTMGHLKSHKKL